MDVRGMAFKVLAHTLITEINISLTAKGTVYG